VAAFDLSAAFDTVNAEQLLPKLSSLQIRGVPFKWFACYMNVGRQIVDLNGARRNPVEIKYGVRQGSILGPLLFHVADLPDTLEHGDGKADLGENGSYADDSHAHAEGATVADALDTLTDKANRFTR
jgi:hypothetical protein